MDPMGHVVSPDVASFLESQKLMEPPVNKKRVLSTSSLSSSSVSSRAPSSSNSVTASSFSASITSVDTEKIEIPENLKSLETYEFIGFDTDTATKMWKSFVRAPEGGDAPDAEFLDYARFQIEHTGVRDIDSLSDDWEETMKGIGISEFLRSSIMMPEFEDLRATHSCKHWLIEAVETAYQALQDLDEQLKMELARRQHIKKIPGHRPSISSKSPLPSLGSPLHVHLR